MQRSAAWTELWESSLGANGACGEPKVRRRSNRRGVALSNGDFGKDCALFFRLRIDRAETNFGNYGNRHQSDGRAQTAVRCLPRRLRSDFREGHAFGRSANRAAERLSGIMGIGFRVIAAT